MQALVISAAHATHFIHMQSCLSNELYFFFLLVVPQFVILFVKKKKKILEFNIELILMGIMCNERGFRNFQHILHGKASLAGSLCCKPILRLGVGSCWLKQQLAATRVALYTMVTLWSYAQSIILGLELLNLKEKAQDTYYVKDVMKAWDRFLTEYFYIHIFLHFIFQVNDATFRGVGLLEISISQSYISNCSAS